MKLKHFGLALSLALLPLAPTMLAMPTYAAATASELGDLSSLRAIVSASLDLVAKGDFVGAEAKITEFETAWDAAEPAMRPLSIDKWNAIDAAADAAFASLRNGNPAAADATTALTALGDQLDNPGASATGVAVIDASGHPVPCEDILKQLRDAEPKSTVDDATKAQAAALKDKGIERCNADDDKRADGFFADAMTLLGV